MTDKWRNTGAPFETEDGRRVGRRDVVAIPDGARDLRMRRHKLEPVAPDVPVTVGPEPEDLDRGAAYPGIEFGSERAYEVARDAKPPVSVAELMAVEPTGAPEPGTGEPTYLTGDVRRALARRGGEA